MVSNFLNNQLLEQYLNRNFAQPVDTGMPVYNTFDLTKGGITGIPTNIPTQNLGFDTSFGVANEEDEEQPKSFRDSGTIQEYFQNRNPITGIMNLLGKLPTPMNILRGGLQSLQGFNQKLRNTDFGRSQNLAEYFDRKSRAKNKKRMDEKYQEFGERDPGDRGKGLESAGVSGGVYGGGAGGLHTGEK